LRFYEEIIKSEDPRAVDRYHRWDSDSIASFWGVCVANPLINQQFYPLSYWDDLVLWVGARIRSRGVTSISRIADLGCGTGNLMSVLARNFQLADIVGVDLSDTSLDHVRARFVHEPRISCRVGSVTSSDLQPKSCDLVTCTEVLEHLNLDDFEASFREISRVLRPGGYYVATIPILEKIGLVNCPSCKTIFTPHQHMIFDISQDDIEKRLQASGMRLVAFYQSIDRSRPGNPIKSVAKSAIVRFWPGIARRLFPRAGVSAFLAERVCY
jgi:ubiquinone/menaquinone biosynthesis C-methylase UbiE